MSVYQVRNYTDIRPRPPAGPQILTVSPECQTFSIMCLWPVLSAVHKLKSFPCYLSLYKQFFWRLSDCNSSGICLPPSGNQLLSNSCDSAGDQRIVHQTNFFLLFVLLRVRDWTYGSSSETARIPEHVIIWMAYPECFLGIFCIALLETIWGLLGWKCEVLSCYSIGMCFVHWTCKMMSE